MIVPVNGWSGAGLTQQNFRFGWRTSPYNGFHRGVDISRGHGSIVSGSPVYAAADGVVEDISVVSGGNSIRLVHNFGGQRVYTWYTHLKEPASKWVSVNQRVKQGTRIGSVGDTGSPGAVHLHFEIQVGKFSFDGYQKDAGYAVDPKNWITIGHDRAKYPSGGYGDAQEVPASFLSAEYKGTSPTAPVSPISVSVDKINGILRGDLAGYGSKIITYANKHGFHPALAASIMMAETGGNIDSSNNPAGVMDWDNNWKTKRRFSTLDEGVEYAIKNMARQMNKGNYDLQSFASVYAPSNAANDPTKLNQHWVPNVTKFLATMGLGPNDPFIGYGGNGTGSLTGMTGGDVSPLASYGDSIDVGRQLGVSNQTTRISGISPNPSNDNLPKHRYEHNPFVLRIGDSQFYIPPLNIQHHKVGSSFAVPTTRSRTSMLAKSGWTEGHLHITMSFANIEQINGFKVDGPDGVKYYMDGIRSLIAQYHKNSMLPIRNEYVNNALGIYNIIIEDIQLTTVPDFPNMINVTIVARECATSPFTGVAEIGYDLCFNYPIWRWYYQHLLIDDDAKRLESVYLRPIDGYMRSDFRVRVIDDAQIQYMMDDLTNEDNITVVDFATEKLMGKDVDTLRNINPSYLLSHFKGANIRALMSEFDLDGIIVESVTGSISKQLSRVNMMEYEEPVFQDLGGMDKVFQLKLKLTDRYQVQQLETLVRIVEEVAREYRHMFVGGFIEVQNDIINMCGVDFCMIEELQCSTTPINGMYEAVVVLREFNPNQANHESLKGIRTDIHDVTEEWIKNNGELAERTYTAHKTDRTQTVKEEYLIETLIKQMELYPDLRLPSIKDANAALKVINDWRGAKGYEKVPFNEFPKNEGDIWVEPDFYFMYPTPSDIFTSMGLTEMGQKIEALIDTGSYDGRIEDIEPGYDTWGELASTAGAVELLGSFSGKRGNTQYIVPEAESKALQAQTTFIYPNEPVYTDFFKEWHADMTMPEPHVLASLMLYDQVKYDQRCRLNRFFPTYMLLFVDEGQWIEGRRLWNTHYAYHAIHEMTVTRDKNNPVDTAYIRLSNMYGTFNSDAKLREPKDYFKYNPTAEGVIPYIKELYQAFHYSAKDLMVDAHKMMDHASLETGARIHLRMGNSSNTGNLPIVFNGQITSVNDGVDIEIFAQSDGVELAANVVSGNPGDSSPGEPHNAIQKYLTKRESNYWFTVASDLEFFNNYNSYYGVEHFGWVQSRETSETGFGKFWNTVFNNPDELATETQSGNIFTWFTELISDFDWMKSILEEFLKTDRDITKAHLEFVVGGITGNPSFVVYDVMKNVFRGRNDLASTGVRFEGKENDSTAKRLFGMFDSMDGEKNVTLAEANKTIWDLGTSMSLFVPEFIFAVHHHGLRSTAFFGMPHWLVKFRYHKPDGADINDLSQWKEEVKPFQQAHVINSSVDMIANNIKASSELLRHDQTALYSMGDSMNTKEGLTVYADKSILSDQRKRDVIDTGVLQDLFGPDSIINGVITIASGIFGVVADTAASIYNTVTTPLKALKIDVPEWNPGEEGHFLTPTLEWLDYFSRSGELQAKDVAIGNVQRNFMEMYQGEMIILGNGAIKPWDIVYMNDERKMMSGTFQAGQVTHTMSRSTGFMTVIKPDLIVTRVDNVQRRSEVLQSAMRWAAFGGMSALRLMSKVKFLNKLSSGTFKKVKTTAIKTAQLADNITHRFGGIKIIDEIHKYIDGKTSNNGKTKENNGKVEVDLTSKNSRMMHLLNKGKTMVKRNLITLAIAGVAEEFFGRWWEKKTLYQNVIYIHPLIKAGVPFTAGVKGALHIIPNYVDGRYADIAGQSIGNEANESTYVDAPFTGSSDVPVVVATPVTTTTETKPIANPVLNYYVEKGSVVHPVVVPAYTMISKQYSTMGKSYGTMFTFNLGAIKSICSIAPGKVVFMGVTKTKGFTIVIEHAGVIDKKTFYSSYHYLNATSSKVKIGDKVSKGQVIGLAGKPPVSSKDGFEFQVHLGTYTDDDSLGNGNRVNPVDFLKKGGVNI